MLDLIMFCVLCLDKYLRLLLFDDDMIFCQRNRREHKLVEILGRGGLPLICRGNCPDILGFRFVGRNMNRMLLWYWLLRWWWPLPKRVEGSNG